MPKSIIYLDSRKWGYDSLTVFEMPNIQIGVAYEWISIA